MGEAYNLIGIDIDNKNGTIEKYQELCNDNDYDRNTLTVKTMNNGYHEYYRLTDKQKNKLKNLHSLDGKIFGLDIDVKYTNQLLYGPSIIKADKEYKYMILIKEKPIIIPDFLFDEIFKCYNNQNKETIIKKKPINNEIKNKKNIEPIIENENEIDKRLELYFNCLQESRFDDYSEWIRLGFIIFNEGGTCIFYDRISQKSKLYDNTCFTKWNTFHEPNLNDKTANLKTLIKMAKMDDIYKYMDALLKDKKTIMNNILLDGINDVICAFLFYCMEPETYIFDVQNNDWYKINKYGIYKKDDGCVLLKDHINKILLNEIEKAYLNKYQEINDEELKNKLTKNFLQTRKYLLNNKNKQFISNELSLLYKQDNIFKKLDNVNNYIIAFDNGVYDLKENIFRNALPEELVTCTTGYNYDQTNEQVIEDLYIILTNIFPDNEERKYILKTLSLGLLGDNLLEEFYIWIGNGRNGKGILRDLLQHTLGNYFDNAEVEYFCQTKHQTHANAADCVLAKKKNCRIVVSTEPEGNTHLRCAKLKQLSGRDPVQVREIFKKPFDYTPKFKLIIQTNRKVTVDGTDTAVIDRLKLITFPNKFVDEPKLPTERKIDRTLKSKLSDIKYKLAFFKILLDHYNDFIQNDNNQLILPPRIKKDTQDFLDDNDPIKQFLADKIDVTNNQKDFVFSSEIYDSFIEYNKEKVQLITTMAFKDILIKKGFTWKRTKHGAGYVGIRIREEFENNNLDQ